MFLSSKNDQSTKVSFIAHDFKVGEEYVISGVIRINNFLVFPEIQIPSLFTSIVTTERGYQPNSYYSKDCGKDSLYDAEDFIDSNTTTNFLSTVPMNPGYNIIIVSNRINTDIDEKQLNAQNPNITILRVDDIDVETNRVLVKVIYNFKYNHMPKNNKFEFAINYAIHRILTTPVEIGIPHFSINRFRNYELRYMVETEDGITGFNNDGKKLLLNRKSTEYKLGQSTGKFMRVFYNKKFENESQIIVDGTELQLITEEDIKTDKDNFIKTFGQELISTLVVMTFPNGNSFFAFYDDESEAMKVIYKSWKKYSTITLNEYEIKLIDAEPEYVVIE